MLELAHRPNSGILNDVIVLDKKKKKMRMETNA